ncbi:MAG TPA: hypothetical protein VIJ71_02740 [Mycobacteriales bacterium]
MEHLAQPPGNSRGNGLHAGGWIRVVDCDPRLTDELLALLADAAIAACAAPSPGERGAYLEVRPPRRPVDRLYVDSLRREDAERLVRGRLERPIGELTGTASPSAQDEAFDAIVADFSGPAGPVVWPDAENVGDDPGHRNDPSVRRHQPPPSTGGLLDPGGLLYDSTIGEGTRDRDDPFADDPHHYEPPPPPPAPRWRSTTKAAGAALLVGLLFLVAAQTGLVTDSGFADAIGGLLMLGGAVALVVNLHDDPREDDGDDGARV